MSLVVRLNQFKMKPSRRTRFVRLEFRRDIRETKPFKVDEELVTVEKTIEWKLQYPLVPGELITIELLSQKWKLNFKMHGMYLMSLDTVIQDKMANIADAMTDKSNRNAGVYIDFQIFYKVPPMPMATIVNERMPFKKEADQVSKSSQNSSDEAQASNSIQSENEEEGGELQEIEKSIANVERTMREEHDRGAKWNINNDNEPGPSRRAKLPMKNILRRTLSFGSVEKKLHSPDSAKRPSLKGMKKMFYFGKNRKRSTYDADEGILMQTLPSTSRYADYSLLTSEDETDTSLGSVDISPIAQKKRQDWPVPTHVSLKPRDFQVCVTILEARQLAGLDIDPIVCVAVGDVEKYTSIKYSTNSPYYNEYFVFDFNLTHTEMFDKIIKFTVFQHRNIFRSKQVIGVFQMDIGTVWNQQDRQFYHKWAMLSDETNFASGPRGYLKCNVSVIGKGDSVKTPSGRERDDDDIEANLLVPDGMRIERQRARFVVKIYRAEGLPQMNSSVIANVKQAITGEVLDLVDPYVEVSYAGRSGSTSVVNNSYTPEWNEKIIFTEMFPPLCHRIKIQLKDNNPLGQNRTIGTHFIDLKSISNDGEKGFLPSFGPAFVHLYGSTRDFNIIDKNSKLNSGEGEGIAYRGRILIEITTELDDNIENYTTNVNIIPINPIIQEQYLKNEEYFLHGVIYEANIIDCKIGAKNLHFEISMGNTGNTIDKNIQQVFYDSNEIESSKFDEGYGTSTTMEEKTQRTKDNNYYYLPYWEDRQAMHIRTIWPDDKQRMYNSNAINKIIESFEYSLSKVQTALQLDVEDNAIAIELLKDALEKVSSECAQYVARTNSNILLGHTKLDKDRLAMCIHEIGQLAAHTRALKTSIRSQCFKEKLKAAFAYLNKLKFICEDPQHTLPDVFIWLLNGTKRLAYVRIPARDIIFSRNIVEMGKFCGIMRTFFLKWPGKKDLTDWAIPVKISAILWLGINTDRHNFVKNIPLGYTLTGPSKDLLDTLSPKILHYSSRHTFQLRSYLYQARSLIGSDNTGLSDPFARVAICDQSGVTEVHYETLNPTWDQTLIFNNINLYFDINYIKENPPTIVIELFDKDNLGKDEFIGRTIARPNVKAFDEEYAAPRFPTKLSWFDIKRGDDNAGELLAAFELLELPPTGCAGGLPPLPPTKYKYDGDPFDIIENCIFKIPTGIRPTLSKYRIEVLFWGLRDLKKVYLQTVEKPRVDIECGGHIISSTVIDNATRNPNFLKTIKYLDVELPDQDEYRPPLTVRVIDCRNFGRETLVGTHIINSINKYIYTPKTKSDRQAEERLKVKLNLEDIDLKNHCLLPSDSVTIENEKENGPLLASSSSTHRGSFQYGASLFQKKLNAMRKKKNVKDNILVDENEIPKDWWTKYHASLEAMVDEEMDNHEEITDNKPTSSARKYPLMEDLDEIKTEKEHLNMSKDKSLNSTLKEKPASTTTKIYPHELEAQKDYDGFKDWLCSFKLYRGKKTSDEVDDDDRVVGVFKGGIKVYKWPLPKELDDYSIMGCDPSNGFFQGLPLNEPKRVLVRVYIVRATGLHPMDSNGKADPYIALQLGPNKISDKEQYISKQLNPVFGKCFEFEAEFPRDSTLTVKVKDWDLVSKDDTIGETKIDLENRFYSRHRATCGLPLKYEEKGYNCWRDSQKPTQILANLCKEGKINLPIYEHGRVRIGRTIFNMPVNNKELFSDPRILEEQMALQVLHRWHEIPKVGTKLVVEHVEQRSLYNTKQPGIEQGRLEMWIDMFPMDKQLPGPPINITPRKPNAYELRVVIWNTDDVVLEDDAFFTGEKMSDIYVKGWLTIQEEAQCTDVHYRSLTGEGNFNWRFVHPFQYLEAEERIVTNRKESVFSWDVNEEKIPARYELQVWDSDHFSRDDCLGAIILDLNRFPRGAKTANLCSLNMLKKDGSVPLVNIFKQKRIKGWWPFYVKQENDKLLLTGKVEAEFQLLTKEEAEKMPAGLGRSEPDPLDKPVRPDASYLCILNPLKSIRYVLWRNHKWTIIKGLTVSGIFFMFIIFLYSIPGYAVKKMLGA